MALKNIFTTIQGSPQTYQGTKKKSLTWRTWPTALHSNEVFGGSNFFFKFLLGCLLLAMVPAQGAGEENPLLWVRILEKQNPKKLEIQTPPGGGEWKEVKLTRGQMTVNGKAQKEASWGTPDSSVKIRAAGLSRIYPGRMTVSQAEGKKGPELFVLNQVPLRDYMACVTAFESAYDKSQPEYLKALSVVVRLYAFSHRHRHPDYGLCDLSHCQVYQGLPPKGDFWEGIVSSAWNTKPTSHFPLSSYYFHSCCGGSLESAGKIWGGDASPNRTGPDEWQGETLCQGHHFFTWTSSASAKDIQAILQNMAGLPEDFRLEDFKVIQRTPHGRGKTFSALIKTPDRQSLEIRVNVQTFLSDFGSRFGWRVFPSNWFEVEKRGDTFHFKGRGFGHGVGLCQAGALRLAQKGFTCREILEFYFPNCF
jgi:SpoIID/LytB domain protein